MERCIHCGCYIDKKLGDKSPGYYQDRTGSLSNPRPPGDYDNICDVCNYDKGLKGGPQAFVTRDGLKTEGM